MTNDEEDMERIIGIERRRVSMRTFEQAFGILGVELEKFTSRTTNF